MVRKADRRYTHKYTGPVLVAWVARRTPLRSAGLERLFPLFDLLKIFMLFQLFLRCTLVCLLGGDPPLVWGLISVCRLTSVIVFESRN